jgi:hypothetical protein
LRHIINPKLQFFIVSKSHRMPRFSRIYADKRTNLGIIIPRKYFQASKLASSNGKTFSQSATKIKEERVEGIGWTST